MVNSYRPTWKTLSAFRDIYFVWGSTYLGHCCWRPRSSPFLLAAIRFPGSGLVLYGLESRAAERIAESAPMDVCVL